jgi:hypothetical protein
MMVRPATAAERCEARAVASFAATIMAAGENNLLGIFALISRAFPNISLRSALCGYVFRRLLVAEEPPRPLPYRANNGTGNAA